MSVKDSQAFTVVMDLGTSSMSLIQLTFFQQDRYVLHIYDAGVGIIIKII